MVDQESVTEAEIEENLMQQPEENQPWVNDSSNPLTRMFCFPEDQVLLLEKHKVNLEGMLYDYLGKFQGYPIWSVKSSVIPVEDMKPASIRLYNDYVKACQEQDQSCSEPLYAVALEFDIDTNG